MRNRIMLVAVLGAAGCSTPAPKVAVPSEEIAAVDEREAAAMAAAVRAAAEYRSTYRIGPADLVTVTVYPDGDLSRKARVDADGAIALPLVGEIAIGGKTVLEAQKAIAAKLDRYIVRPQVNIFVEEYGNKLLYVMGEVQNPGSYPIPPESRMTVLQAISAAGGLTAIAAPNRTRVLRHAQGKLVDLKVDVRALTRNRKEDDLPLEPNDVVFVPQSFF